MIDLTTYKICVFNGIFNMPLYKYQKCILQYDILKKPYTSINERKLR